MLKDVTSVVGRSLEPLGFRRRGSRFYVERDGNSAGIDLHRRPHPAGCDEVLIVVFATSRLRNDAFGDPVEADFAINIPREGGAENEYSDKHLWWTLWPGTSDADAALVHAVTEQAAPLALRMLSPVGLRDEMVRRRQPQVLQLREAETLIAIVANLGPPELIPPVLTRLQQNFGSHPRTQRILELARDKGFVPE